MNKPATHTPNTRKKTISDNSQKKAKRAKRIGVFFACLSSFAAICSVLFYLLVFSNVSPFAYLRGLWIETAMSTWHHHWLAESFFPGDKIAEVLDAIDKNQNIIGGAEALKPNDAETTQPPDKEVNDDILGQKTLVVGGKDYAGNTVLINDIEEGLVVSEIVGSTFKGKIMLIDDPARVYLGQTPYPGEKGLRIRAMMEHYGAIAGINASGFNDPYESGDGGTVVGLSCSNGEYWGEFTYAYGSIVLTEDNKLVVGNISSLWKNYNIRDGMQFGPVLIADGEAQVSGSAGYGIHPRTAIGQREDGVIAFLIIDGRDVSHSLGCTVGDLVDILEKYDIINAACCDGGASSVLAYKDEVITKNCSLNPAYGRPLPNAFLVRSKAEMAELKGDN